MEFSICRIDTGYKCTCVRESHVVSLEMSLLDSLGGQGELYESSMGLVSMLQVFHLSEAAAAALLLRSLRCQGNRIYPKCKGIFFFIVVLVPLVWKRVKRKESKPLSLGIVKQFKKYRIFMEVTVQNLQTWKAQ